MSSEGVEYRPTQDLVCELTEYLIKSGAENYIEDSYTITMDTGTVCDAVVTVQYTNSPTAHELRVKAEKERDALSAELAALKAASGEEVEVVAYRVSLPGEPELGHWLEEEAEEEPQIQHHEPLMTVAQHQRITAALRGEVAKWRQQFDCMQLQRDHHRSSANELRAELDAIRKQQAERVPVATVEQREPYEDGTPNPGKTLSWAGDNAEDDLPAGAKLYAAPPAAAMDGGMVGFVTDQASPRMNKGVPK